MNNARESGSPSEENELSPEDRAALSKMTADYRKQMHELAMKGGEPAKDTEHALHHALFQLQERVKEDPEMVTLLNSFLRKLGTAASFGNGGEQLSHSKKEDIKSVLIGATMALEGYRDVASQTEKQPTEHVQNAARFLELVKDRVGETKPDGSFELRMVVHDDQSRGKIKYKK